MAAEEHAIVRHRWIAGWSVKGRCFVKLLVKDKNDPDTARLFVPPNYRYQKSKTVHHFFCECRRKLSMRIENGIPVLTGTHETHDPSCAGASYRIMFFELKKWILAFGNEMEIREYEAATRFNKEEPGCVKVDQRDWVFGQPERGVFRILFIREEGSRRNLARKYVMEEQLRRKDSKREYACSNCLAILVCHRLPSGHRIVFKPLENEHAEDCTPKDVSELSKEVGYPIEDLKDLDFYRIVPKEDYILGFSPAGDEDSRLYIKLPEDPTLCHEFTRVNPSMSRMSDKIYFMCSGCQSPFFAYYIHGANPRLIGPNVCHPTCHPISVESVLQAQVQYSGKLFKLPERFEGLDVSTIPSVPTPMFQLNKHLTEVLIKSDMMSKYAHKFKLTEDSPRGDNVSMTFQCVGCSNVAFLVRYVHGKMIVRNDYNHEETCYFINVSTRWLDATLAGAPTRLTRGIKRRILTPLEPVLSEPSADDEPSSVLNLDASSLSMDYLLYDIQSEYERSEDFLFDNILKNHDGGEMGPIVPLIESSPPPGEGREVLTRSMIASIESSKKKENPPKKKAKMAVKATPPVAPRKSLREVQTACFRLEPVQMADNQNELEQVLQDGDGAQDILVLKRELDDIIEDTVRDRPPSASRDVQSYFDQLNKSPEQFNQAPPDFTMSVKPTTVWIHNCCSVFNVQLTGKILQHWVDLAFIDLEKGEFPPINKIKPFDSGYKLISYLCTGVEQNSIAVKNKLNAFFNLEYKNFGEVAGLDCSSLTDVNRGMILYSEDALPIHFAALSRMVDCSVFVYDYINTTLLSFYSSLEKAPTMVVGYNVNGYFLFLK